MMRKGNRGRNKASQQENKGENEGEMPCAAHLSPEKRRENWGGGCEDEEVEEEKGA